MLTSPCPNVLTSLLLLCFAVLGAAVLGLMAVPGWPPSSPLLTGPGVASAPAGGVYEARLAKGTEGQLRQVALHLSKMQGGKSIGGFPGFEPPEDDEEYRRKIEDEAYSARDVNDWVKEINNFLGQVVKRNPGLSLEEILQRQGLSQAEIDGFFRALQRAHVTADGMEGHGVNLETVERLQALMKTLGVPTWTY